jgi:hypothetical protein
MGQGMSDCTVTEVRGPCRDCTGQEFSPRELRERAIAKKERQNRSKNSKERGNGNGNTEGAGSANRQALPKRWKGPKENVCSALFDLFDARQNGFLRISELNFQGMKHADLFMRLCDLDKDQRIDKPEFEDWTIKNIVRHLSDSDVERTIKLCQISCAGKGVVDAPIVVMFNALDLAGFGRALSIPAIHLVLGQDSSSVVNLLQQAAEGPNVQKRAFEKWGEDHPEGYKQLCAQVREIHDKVRGCVAFAFHIQLFFLRSCGSPLSLCSHFLSQDLHLFHRAI